MPSTVIFDADCGLCQRTRAAVEALDWLGTMRWVALQDPAAGAFGIAREALEQSVFFVDGRGRTFHGFDAVKQVLLRVPALYLAAGLAIRKKPLLLLPAVLFFSPLFQPAGERLYAWVAANRYRFPGSSCVHFPAALPMG